ncbi:hypothetical protein [Aneurinibacillus thermoaerophilus]|uniref:hypothetical protein n=1 Tax=Aneurinibacillus thermoaerophilus TaxID=143495 RepID=UPI002E206CA9|nr:hypothetical protein [Aneurinibacillus thermoaerophilus]
MGRKKMPEVLKGLVPWIRKRIINDYRNDIEQLQHEDTWYKEVVDYASWYVENIHRDDLNELSHYFSVTEKELEQIQEKYGYTNDVVIVTEKMMDLFNKAYEDALSILENESRFPTR